MKNRWKLVFLWSICFSIHAESNLAQCPEQGIPVLETQAMIDSFLTIYPGCEYIQGTISINNVPVYWVKEEPWKYLMTLVGVLVVILGLLKLIFRKVSWFQK